MGENNFSTLPTQLYGVVLCMSGAAYWILQTVIIAAQGEEDVLKKAIGFDWKGKLSPILYIIAIVVANWSTWISMGIYTFVALMWIVPDQRIEKMYHT